MKSQIRNSKNGFSRLALGAAVVLIGLNGLADSPSDSAFDAANKLYAGNKFSEAAAGYEGIIKSGSVSSALLFNLGNAQFKAGRTGLAIAAYRRAAALAPRDADLRANLQFVRGRVQGPTVRAGFVERGLGVLSLNEWAGLSAVTLWFLFGLLAWRQIRPGSGAALRNPTLAAAAMTLILGAALGLAAHFGSPGRTVVVIAGETPVRITPNDEARSAFTVNDGAELRVLDRKDNWLQVSDGGARNFGWLKREQVAAD